MSGGQWLRGAVGGVRQAWTENRKFKGVPLVREQGFTNSRTHDLIFEYWLGRSLLSPNALKKIVLSEWLEDHFYTSRYKSETVTAIG